MLGIARDTNPNGKEIQTNMKKFMKHKEKLLSARSGPEAVDHFWQRVILYVARREIPVDRFWYRAILPVLFSFFFFFFAFLIFVMFKNLNKKLPINNNLNMLYKNYVIHIIIIYT